VQYHPEAAAGPHDANYLFDRFAELVRTHQLGRLSSPPKAGVSKSTSSAADFDTPAARATQSAGDDENESN
jgi:carbamoyl-phosphate synthase small subunit